MYFYFSFYNLTLYYFYDLSPTYHIKLTQWCAETADAIGTARVTGQDVIRALVARLLMDEGLARKIRADLSIDI